MKVQSKPYNAFLLTGLIIVLFSFFPFEKTMDIHMHDTFYVIAFAHAFWFLAIILFVLWLLYRLTSRILFSRSLTLFHVTITVFSSLVFITLMFWDNSLGKPIIDGDNSVFYEKQKRLGHILLFATLALIFGQGLYLVNLIVGGVKKLNSR